MASPNFQAFTVKANSGRLNRILTDVTVCSAFDPAAPPDPLPQQITTKALWDTGATHSVISTDIAQALGLISVGISNVSHGGGATTSPRYAVNFVLPHRVVIGGVLVTEFPAPSDGSFSVIVGMDIICFGDLSITNVSGQTWMSFRTPSCLAIDYVGEANKMAYAGTHRNAPCPCGSGAKYKKCHGG